MCGEDAIKMTILSFFLGVFMVINCAYHARATKFEELERVAPKVSGEEQEVAVGELIKRVLPERANDFVVKIDTTIGPVGKDTFRLRKLDDNRIEITGTTGVSIASGFHTYLKDYCSCHISWEANQLNLPQQLPAVDILVTSNDKFRYYQNVCTTSYSFVWWDWAQWEKHIDWMALNSLNLVLAFNGQEAIWERIYEELNMTRQEIEEHFSGPAFLSWNRMGNLRGWGGPLSKPWHERSLVLQKRILQRMRSLGIMTVLPAFSGQVPKSFKRLYPNAKLYPLTRWNKFNDSYCCPYLLDPTEPLFKTIGNRFIKEMMKEFGSDHFYNCDTFNEMTPFTSNTTYLKSIGESIYAAMTDVDPDAIWLMQGWMFHYEKDFWTPQIAKSLITSVPLGKMIILDLQSEQFPQYGRFESYFGQPYIWCMLHNFGGTLGMFGSSDIINEEPFKARNDTTMIGTGLTPEGINQNYVIYDLMAENAWKKSPVNLTNWFSAYTTRRYGVKNDKATAAWEILRKTIYNYKGILLMRGKFIYNRSPKTRIPTWTWYNNCEVLEAWDYLLDASTDLGSSPAYRHDLVDLTRQVMQNFGDEFYNEFIPQFRKKNVTEFQRNSERFLAIFPDINRILSSDKAFLLGNWLNSAKKAASNKKEEALFEYNARNQITLWGPSGEIKDYANKQWAGMVSDFFQPRWTLFVKLMNESLINGRPFKEAQAARAVFQQVEEPFTYSRTPYTDQPIGDTVQIAREIHAKWRWSGHCRVQRSEDYNKIVEPVEWVDNQTPRVILVD